VRDRRVFNENEDSHTRRFLERAFRFAGVGSVSVDRTQGSALVRPAVPPRDAREFATKLAEALRTDRGPAPSLPRGVRELVFTVHRHGALLSTCEVVVDKPGLLRIRHVALRRDRVLAREFRGLMTSLPGVLRAALDLRTGALTLRYNPAELVAARLIRQAEEILDAPDWWCRAVPPPPQSSYAIANTNLAVGAGADLVMSALAPASAVLLLGSNLRTFRLAWNQVRERKLGLPVLYTVIIGGTLASGQFLASALMSWSFKFWQDRLGQDLSAERRRLLSECLPLPRLARLACPKGELFTPVDHLKPGDQVLVDAGEIVPADGKVIEGEATVDEQTVRGLKGASRAHRGSLLLAGSTVLAGSLRLAIERPVACTKAFALGRSLLAATSPAPGASSPTETSDAFAERAVAPTMAMAGLGLLVGDLTVAAAILRPDYATGPGVAGPLETLRDASACARAGIVVRTPDAFQRLSRVDTVVLDDSPALRAPALELKQIQSRLPEPILLRYAASALRHMADERAEALIEACVRRRTHILDLPAVNFGPGVTIEHGPHRVCARDLDPSSDPRMCGPLAVEVDGNLAGILKFERSEGLKAARVVERISAETGASVVLVSDRPDHEVAELAAQLGVSTYLGGLSVDEKTRFLRDLRDRGSRAAFIGDPRGHRDLASAVEIAVSTAGEADPQSEHAHVVLLQPHLDLFAELARVARSHALKVKNAQQLVILPNALCVAGALFFGVTALAVVIVSNLSTFELYRRASGSPHVPIARGSARFSRRLVAGAKQFSTEGSIP
jgi:Cu2+-exporting ATPase